MTATADRATDGPTTYGNWARPRTPGLIPRLGIVGSAGLLAGIVLVLLTAQARGFTAGVAVLVLLLAGLAPALYRSPAGRNGWQVAAGQAGWAAGKARGQHLYLAAKVPPRPGDGQPVAFGQHRLPGLLASSKLFEVATPTGQRVALVHVPAARHYTVQLGIAPEGDALVDQDTIDAWVAGWAGWLGNLGHEPALVAAVVTVEAAPDPGHRLAAEVGRQITAGCPTFAAVDAPRGAVTSRVLAALLGECKGALRKRVTLTFRPHRAGDAAAIVDADVRTAIGWEGARAGEAKATETAALAAARQTAREEAAGAGLTRFALLVTVTADPAALEEVAEQAVQLGRASRLRLRRCYGSQAAAFAAALGVGLVLPAHVAATGAAP